MPALPEEAKPHLTFLRDAADLDVSRGPLPPRIPELAIERSIQHVAVEFSFDADIPEELQNPYTRGDKYKYPRKELLNTDTAAALALST